jgi:hypothetical protein
MLRGQQCHRLLQNTGERTSKNTDPFESAAVPEGGAFLA